MSAFIQELVRILATFSRSRSKAEPVTPTGLLHGAYRPSSVRSADLYRRKQRDPLVLLLGMAFLLASLSSFLSLLDFNPHGSGAACGGCSRARLWNMPWTDACLAFVVALSSIASQAARVFGLLILGLNLRHWVSGPWELWTFWLSLALVTGSCWLHVSPPIVLTFFPIVSQVLNGVIAGLESGQLVYVLVLL